MEQRLKNILYVLVAVTLAFITNYFIIAEIMDNIKEEEIKINENVSTTKANILLTEEYGLYNKFELVDSNLDRESQEWYRVLLRSDCIVKFQYFNTVDDISKLNLYINNIKIENEEEFNKDDKFKINFHLYENILVVEHQKENNRVSFIKIIDLTTGETRNLPNNMDFYINNVEVNYLGIRISYSRHQLSLDNYINAAALEIPFSVNGEEVNINICESNSWPEELYDLDYVIFNITYKFIDNKLDLDNPEFGDLVNFKNYVKPYLSKFRSMCR